MDFALLYLRRNATITRQRRLKLTIAKTRRRSMPWKIAKLAAKYKRCEISANVRHCTRLKLFKYFKFLEFRKFPSKISQHSPLNGRMILHRLWSRNPRTRCLWDRSSSEISEVRRRWKKMKRWYRWSRWILFTCGCESRPRSREIRAVLRADAALAEADRLANY